MSDSFRAFDAAFRRGRLPGSRHFPSSAAPIAAGALALSLVGGFSLAHRPTQTPVAAVTQTPVETRPIGRLVGLRPFATPTLAEAERAADAPPSAEQAAVATAEPDAELSAAPTPPIRPFADNSPLPPRRPADLALSSPDGSAPGSASNRSAQRLARAAAPAAPIEGPSFFERLLGEAKPSGAALAYAAPETGETRAARGLAVAPAARYDNTTAVYDISAHTVYLPDGTRLEAHSGLRERLDDPRYVHEKMRGATPPNLYDLSLRERLFHGVQALRLTPLRGGVYGRAGLLAHTYMLGPNGDSNGCVSFRDYDAFLRAYRSGQVKRLAVVAKMD